VVSFLLLTNLANNIGEKRRKTTRIQGTSIAIRRLLWRMQTRCGTMDANLGRGDIWNTLLLSIFSIFNRFINHDFDWLCRKLRSMLLTLSTFYLLY